MKTLCLLALVIAPAIACADKLAPAAPINPNSVPPPIAIAENTLDPVTVTATRTPVPDADVLAETIVIDRAQIEQVQGRDVTDVLRQYAGLEVARTGGPGQPASLFIRGGNSNYTLVLIDGIRVNNGSDGAAALANIDTAMIERIEVVEGPRAALYGPDAVGGVVNILTRKPGPAQVDANIGGGTFDTLQGGAAVRDAGNIAGLPWGATFGAQQQHTGGFPTYQGSDDSRAFRNRTLNGSAQLEVSGVQLQARAWDAKGNSEYENVAYDPTTFAFVGFTPASENFHDQILALEASTRLLSNWQSSLTFSRSQDKLVQRDNDDYVRTARPELDWHNVVDFGADRLSFGARARRDHIDANSFGSAIVENKDNDYGYLQNELNLGSQHAIAALSYLHDGGFGERFDWNAEYGYDVLHTSLGKTTVLATVGTAFHAPTANDRFGFGGNPALQPEKAFNYEFGLKQELGANQRLALRLFRTDVRDLISVAFSPANDPNVDFGYRAVNLAHTRSDGVQGSWLYADSQWSARADAIWQDPRQRNVPPDPNGAPQQLQLLRRARIAASASATRHLGRFDLGAGVYSSGDRKDIGAIDGAPTTDGGYALLNLNAGVRLTRELRLDTRIENTFNHHYQTAAGYNQAGTAAYATLRYSLPL